MHMVRVHICMLRTCTRAHAHVHVHVCGMPAVCASSVVCSDMRVCACACMRMRVCSHAHSAHAHVRTCTCLKCGVWCCRRENGSVCVGVGWECWGLGGGVRHRRWSFATRPHHQWHHSGSGFVITVERLSSGRASPTGLTNPGASIRSDESQRGGLSREE